jgi:hypothetical protein
MNLSPERDIIAHLAHPADARLLFTHTYVGAIGAEGGSYQFVDPVSHKSRRLRGLTTVLAQLYWPAFTPWRAKGKEKGAANGNGPLKRTLQSVAQVTKNKRPRAGASAHGPGLTPIRPAALTLVAPPTLTAAARGHVRGSIMHRQMEDLMTLDAESFRRRNPDGEHPWTARLFRALIARGKIPLASEFRVADLALGVATRIDLVAVDEKTGHLCFLEYKTAGSRELFHVAETSEAPLERVLRATRLPNSALVRAMLQATVGATMAVKMLGLRNAFEVTVVLVTEQAIDFIDIQDDFILGTGVAVYHDMARAAGEARPPKEQSKGE